MEKFVSITTSHDLASSFWTILLYSHIIIESVTFNSWKQFAEFTPLNALKKKSKTTHTMEWISKT